MNKQRNFSKFENYTWGSLLIWWGITDLAGSLSLGIKIIGFGAILLGLNAVRLLSGLPVNRFSTILGTLVVLWGGLELAEIYLKLPFEIPVFGILLIVIGLSCLPIEFFGKNKKLEV